MISDIILSVALIILSCVWAGIGIFKLGLWVPGVSADSGFIPTVFSVVTLICSVLMLIQTLKKRKSGELNQETVPEEKADADPEAPQDWKSRALAFIRQYAIILFGVFGALALKYLGLVPMSFLVIFGWMKLMNRASWVKSLTIGALATASIFLIFDMWLKIPFPGLI